MQIITLNLNTVQSYSWLERTPNGFRGMHHTREVTPDGKVVRDITGETGVVVTYDPPSLRDSVANPSV